MNYKKIYKQLIQRSIDTNRQRNKNIYYESHHIVPKCIGGSEEADNLVLLTAREHFIAHWILTKLYPNTPKIIYAFNCFCLKLNGCQNKSGTLCAYTSSKNYEYARQKIIHLLKGTNRPEHISKNLSNTTYINNGTYNKRIKVCELYTYMLQGWTKGRLKYTRSPKLNKKQYNYHPNINYRCSEQRRIKAKEQFKNNPHCWVSKGSQCKQILLKDYETYENDGWRRGVRNSMVNPNLPTHCHYIKQGDIFLKVKKGALQAYIECGWTEITYEQYLNNKEEL